MKTLPRLGRASARRLRLITIATALAFGGSAPFCWSEPAGQTNQIPVLSSDPWQVNQLIQPDQLANSLVATTGEKPLVICVAFPVLYQGGHVVGAKFAGPGSKPEGIEALKRTVEGLPQDKQIVLYCGCCPWEKCPIFARRFARCRSGDSRTSRRCICQQISGRTGSPKGFPLRKELISHETRI